MPTASMSIPLVAMLATALPGTAFGQSTGFTALYEAKCGGCHSVDANRVGPLHRGVVGRKVASVAGYEYSDALKMLGGTWTTERLDRWLRDPQEMAPGTKMYFVLSDAEDRARIISYLKSVSEATPVLAK